MRVSPLFAVAARLLAPLLAVGVLLALYAAPVAAGQIDDASMPYVVVGTGGEGLLLRAGPSADQPVVAVLPEGSGVRVLPSPPGEVLAPWLHVEMLGAGSLGGYASGAYLAPPEQEAATVASAAAPPPGSQRLTGVVTGYANGSDGGAVGSITASGTHTHWGTVAADWRLYPRGTRLTIEGFEGTVFVVEDTGSGVRGNVFDVWFPDVPAAARFGTQRREVVILLPGS